MKAEVLSVSNTNIKKERKKHRNKHENTMKKGKIILKVFYEASSNTKLW